MKKEAGYKTVDGERYGFRSGFFDKRAAQKDVEYFRSCGAKVKMIPSKIRGRTHYDVWVRLKDWEKREPKHSKEMRKPTKLLLRRRVRITPKRPKIS